MANIKVSELTEATEFDNGDYTMIVQANQNKKISKENMLNNINATIGNLSNLATEDKTNLVNSINELKNAEIYSTNEGKTNKMWIDGKPIYRKVIVTTLNGNEEQTIDMGIANVLDVVVKFDGCILSSNQYRPLNSTYFGGINWAVQSFINSNKYFTIQAGTNARNVLNGATLNLIIYYTKVTN